MGVDVIAEKGTSSYSETLVMFFLMMEKTTGRFLKFSIVVHTVGCERTEIDERTNIP
jgi:hypothetical protein